MEKTENRKNKIWLFLVILATILLLYVVLVQDKKDDPVQPSNEDIQSLTNEEPANQPVLKEDTNKNNNKNNMTDIKEFSFEVLKEGSGQEAITNNTVTVEYKGMFTDGKVFYQGEFPFALGVGQVVAGFDKGVMGMKVGETRKIYIPSEMGYGSRGAGSAIPPNTDLIFEVTLKSIN